MAQHGKGKTVIVTGSSRGIGRAMALRLAQDGFSIVVNYAGSKAEAESAVTEIEAAGGQAIAVQADVSKPADAARLFEAAERAFGGVDIVVNNAGAIILKPIAETEDDAFDRIIAVNLKGTFNMLKLASAKLRNGGRIVNVSTSALGLSLPGYATYNASKAAVEAMTPVLAKELRGRQITVNTLSPGPVSTDLFYEGKTEEQVKNLTRMPPLERLGEVGDIAGVIAFLVGPEGGWINSQTIRVNGGIV